MWLARTPRRPALARHKHGHIAKPPLRQRSQINRLKYLACIISTRVVRAIIKPSYNQGRFAMTRTATLALVIALLSGGASAQPLALNNAQLDGVFAGVLNLSVLTAAISHVPSSVTLPPPLIEPLAIPQAVNITIGIDATVHPAVISIVGPTKP